jgi:uncharacterized membrane protein YdbT with pleckstrin-like domain
MPGKKHGGIQFVSEKERLVFHAKESWKPLAIKGGTMIALGIAGWAAARSLVGNQMLANGIAIAFALFALVLTVPGIIENLDTDVIVSDKRIYLRKGIIDIKDSICDLGTVSDVQIDPDIFGRILDYADVKVSTFSGEGDFEMKGLARAYDFRTALFEAIDDLHPDGRPMGKPREKPKAH